MHLNNKAQGQSKYEVPGKSPADLFILEIYLNAQYCTKHSESAVYSHPIYKVVGYFMYLNNKSWGPPKQKIPGKSPADLFVLQIYLNVQYYTKRSENQGKTHQIYKVVGHLMYLNNKAQGPSKQKVLEKGPADSFVL